MSEIKNDWKRIVIKFEEDDYGTNHFLETYFSVIKKYCVYPKEDIVIRKKDGFEYKFTFDWQNEDTCGIDVYRRVAE